MEIDLNKYNIDGSVALFDVDHPSYLMINGIAYTQFNDVKKNILLKSKQQILLNAKMNYKQNINKPTLNEKLQNIEQQFKAKSDKLRKQFENNSNKQQSEIDKELRKRFEEQHKKPSNKQIAVNRAGDKQMSV